MNSSRKKPPIIYPFNPAWLDAAPEEISELFRDLELKLLYEICSRIAIRPDSMNEVTVQDIRALRSHGIPLKEIEAAIRETAHISEQKLDSLLSAVVERNQAYYGRLATLADITMPERIIGQPEIDAIRRQTWGALENLTTSMGFLVRRGGRLTLLEPAKAYWNALDKAVIQIESGAVSYEQAISEVTRELADSGLRTVDFESGHIDSVDVAVRRAVMTGVHQLNARYTEQSAEYLNTRYFQITAHVGARDKVQNPARPWQDHKSWQGRVYYASDHGEPDPLGKYKDLAGVTGLGEVDGLEGANCRHIRNAWVEGVMERTWTDEQLAHIDDNAGCDFEGKHYSAYEATQYQRYLERTIRKWKKRKAAAMTDEDKLIADTRLQLLHKKYRDFSKAAGLPEQWERTRIYQTEKQAEKPVEKSADRGKIEDKLNFVENAPCETTPKKFEAFFLKPGQKHSKEFFDVGYEPSDALQLRYDVAKQFDISKAYNDKLDDAGFRRFSIDMRLGVSKKKLFQTVWRVDRPDGIPRIITAHRKDEK